MPRPSLAPEQTPTRRPRPLVAVGRHSAARRKAVSEYVYSLARILRLADWEYEIPSEPCEDGSCATIDCVFGQKRAVLHLAADFFTHDGPWQRQTLVHELVHCHLAQSRWLIYKAADEILSKAAAAALFLGFDQNLEYATDGLADAIAPLVPLPVWPTEPATRRPAVRPVSKAQK